MNADALIAWLSHPTTPQRDKLGALHELYLATIRDMFDDDHARVMREIRKRINSPKLVGELTALIRDIERGRTSKPRLEPALLLSVSPRVEIYETDRVLEAAIAADPNTRDHYIVLGDVLTGRGDPRGGLIAIGQELAKAPGHKQMLAAHGAHFAEHRDAIMGPLATCDDLVTHVAWFMGFIRSCRVALSHERESGKRPNIDIADVVSWLLDEPGPARFLQELTVGIVRHDGNTYEGVCNVIAARSRPSLRALNLGDFTSEETELNWSTIGNISKLWPMLPNLRELTLRSGSMSIGPINLPRLESLTTITGGLDPESTQHIASASWPALTKLSLQIGGSREGAPTDVRVVGPILRGTELPKLRHLGITNCEFTDALCEQLPNSPLLPQLEEIDLSMGTMSIDGARALHEHRSKLADIKLIVDDNYLTDEARALLTATTSQLVFGSQRNDEGDPNNRYASAFE